MKEELFSVTLREIRPDARYQNKNGLRWGIFVKSPILWTVTDIHMDVKLKVITVGDKTTTGGYVQSGALTVFCDGRPVALIGSLSPCPKCGVTGVIRQTRPFHVIAENKQVCLEGDVVECGCPQGSNRLIASPGAQEFIGYSDGMVGSRLSLAEAEGFSIGDVEPEQFAQAARKAKIPSYLSGEKEDSGFTPDYPVLRNTRDLPDEVLRNMLKANNQDVMLLELTEIFEVLASWGAYKQGWTSITQSGPGQIVVNYGVNIKDVVTTSMVISQLGNFGIRATMYVNHKGTELIKLSGYAGIRKILNAPVFAAKNPKVVDLGIGKYGLKNSIVSGARLTFYVAAAYRTVDFILNDATSLARFIGSLATDVAKIGIASAIGWGAGIVAMAIVSTVSVPLVVVVVAGFVSAIGLNLLDDKFGITDKLVIYIEHSQQEFVEKAKELEKGLLDLGAMYADKMLEKGKAVIEHEVRKYIRSLLGEFNMRIY